MAALRIDFNCDLGEGCGQDAAIVPLISSASLACGGHAGDARTMREAVELCLAHGVAIGAHPSLVDHEGFGRRDLPVTAAEVEDLVSRQLETLAAVVEAAGGRLAHLKPHGALYNRAARDHAIADAIARATARFDRGLALYGLAGSELTVAAAGFGLRPVHEVFAERRYGADGRLVPRGEPGAVIETTAEAVQQVLSLLRDGTVIAIGGETIPVRSESLCLHGDRPDAAAFARVLRETLEAEGVEIRAPSAATSQCS